MQPARTDVVHQEVNRPVGLDRGLDERRRPLRLREIDRNSDHIGQVGDRRDIARARHHVHAVLEQLVDDRPPDAPAGAGDHGDLPAQTKIHAATLPTSGKRRTNT